MTASRSAKAKIYGLEVSDTEVDSAFANMATRQHITAQQFSPGAGAQRHHAADALKARFRAELTWNQFVRGKFGSSLQVSDGDVTNAM